MNTLDKIALKGIECYKTKISPLKGWKCAYGVTHGISCSTVTANLIKEHGMMNARPFIKQQFADCGAEFERLKAEKESNSLSNQYCNSNNKCDNCDVPFWGCSGFRGGKSSSSSCDIDGCDIGSCDL